MKGAKPGKPEYRLNGVHFFPLFSRLFQTTGHLERMVQRSSISFGFLSGEFAFAIS
jgi:hypothetical protein